MRTALAAPHTAALDAARTAGGNAIDQVLAAATTLIVAYSHQCHLGGDLIAIVREPDGTVHAVLSAGAAPRGVDVDAIRAAHGRMPQQGALPVTVPGIAAGWDTLAGLGATVPLAQHLRAAAALADEGLPVAPDLARAIVNRADAIAADPGLRAVFGSKRAGEILRQPALAASLRAVADDGIRAIYGGAVGERLVAFLRSKGSAMTIEDLAGHEVEITAPLVGEALGATWHVAPPPSAGATFLAMLGGVHDGRLDLDRARAAIAARDALLGDPRAGAIDVAALRGARGPEVAASATVASAAGDTVAMTAVDEEGRAVTLIQSLYMHFGAGLLDPESGIVLHNRGGGFTIEPGHPGCIGGGARPPHTLCPALVHAGDAIVAFGCQGGRAQPQILAQLATAVADPASDLAAAVARPRWVLGGPELGHGAEAILAEPGADAPEEAASDAGIPVVGTGEPTGRVGHVQTARVGPGGLAAGSDPRADGGVLLR